jgi:hypothetical protein
MPKTTPATNSESIEGGIFGETPSPEAKSYADRARKTIPAEIKADKEAR